MKKLLFTAVLIFSQMTLASKARVSALQEANHLIDHQTVFYNPSHLNKLTPYITYEMGTPQGAPAAEGGFAQKLENGAMLGIYLGHDNSSSLRDGATYIKQRNPIEVTYATGQMGFAGSVSTTDDKKNGKKETTVVGKWGMIQDDMQVWTNIAVVSTAEQTTPSQKLTSPYITVGGSKTVENNRFFGAVNYSPAKEEIASVSTDVKETGAELGWLSHNLKNADADIYYGAKLAYQQQDVGGQKITATRLPVFLGLEYAVTSWATFRGSVKQNFIVGSTKDETATNTEAESAAADTTFSGGLGLKYNKLTLDGSLASSTNGAINGNAFLTQASITYNF